MASGKVDPSPVVTVTMDSPPFSAMPAALTSSIGAGGASSSTMVSVTASVARK